MVVNEGGNIGNHGVKAVQSVTMRAISNLISKGGNIDSTSLIGPEEDELNGLLFEDRKRQRSDSSIVINKVQDTNKTNTESGFSGQDYTDSSPNFLATLAQQASHSQ